jgi:hypothetical protein
MKVKKMGVTEILRRSWLFSANKIKSSESFSKQLTQLIVQLNSSLRQTGQPLIIFIFEFWLLDQSKCQAAMLARKRRHQMISALVKNKSRGRFRQIF